MGFRLEFRPQVAADVRRAAAWYNNKEPGLGARFRLAVERRIEELLKDPLLPRIRDQRRDVRWVFPEPFPYRIVYRVSGQTVLIIAVLHAARHERRWKRRAGLANPAD